MSDRRPLYSLVPDRTPDSVVLDRALGILYRLSLENTGWRSFFRRWHYSDEPLRNDAANLVRECGYVEKRPINTKSIAHE